MYVCVCAPVCGLVFVPSNVSMHLCLRFSMHVYLHVCSHMLCVYVDVHRCSHVHACTSLCGAVFRNVSVQLIELGECVLTFKFLNYQISVLD